MFFGMKLKHIWDIMNREKFMKNYKCLSFMTANVADYIKFYALCSLDVFIIFTIFHRYFDFVKELKSVKYNKIK
jgi:hypothetical protein